jgi:hypothetical protein
MPTGVYQHKPNQGFQKGNKITLGIKLSEEHKKKIGKGNKLALSNPAKRKKRSKIMKKMWKDGTIKHDPRNGFQKGHPNYIIEFTEEHKRKIGISNRKRFENKIYKTDESKIWRTRIEYKLWRKSVFERDNFTCQKCRIKGGHLHPHHILNFSQYPELRFDMDNGITLCKECHKLFHKIYGKQNNTREQLNEFLRT